MALEHDVRTAGAYGPPAWSTNPNLRGLTAMQVRLTPRASTTVASGQTA